MSTQGCLPSFLFFHWLTRIGGIAIEDATSLVALLRAGTPKSEIPERLALYEKIRMNRAHRVQQYTRIAGEDLVGEKKEAFNVIEFNNYNFAHDEWHNTTHQLNKWLWSRNGPTYWRQPTAFGPMTSPRRDHWGAVVPSKDGRFRTWRVGFTSSATYLQTLFPSDAFSFAMPGTKARASFMLNELDNLDWLGGGGYRFFGLWIHGVRYTKADGSVLTGSYLPVLFENLCDPIITGREELGMPKLFCDIDLDEGTDAAAPTIVCSWRGAKFARMTIEGLRPETDADKAKAAAPAGPPPGAPAPPPGVVIPKPPPDNGLFIYRSVPSVGQRGTPDAEYAVFVPHASASCPRVVERRLVAPSASIALEAGSPQTLPTLHHVATGLAEVPIYSVDEASYEEGHGVDELSQAYRIE